MPVTVAAPAKPATTTPPQPPKPAPVRKPLWSDADDSDDEPPRSTPAQNKTVVDQRTTGAKTNAKPGSTLPPKPIQTNPDEWMEFGWNGWTKVYRSPEKRRLAEEEAKRKELEEKRSHLPPLPTINQNYVRKRQKMNLSLADLDEKDDEEEWDGDEDGSGKKKKKKLGNSGNLVTGGRDLVKETARQWGRDFDDNSSGNIGEGVKRSTRKAAPKTILDYD